jgi:hypothetical protein
MYYVPLDDDDTARAFGESELSANAATDAALAWVGRYEDVEHYAWAIRQRIEYRVPPNIAFTPPPDCADEGATVAEIGRLLQEKRMKVFSELNRYRN